jgi:prevent-host-death family protein
MHTWQLQEAKAKLSEVVRFANTEGPQSILVRGEECAVVLSRKEYETLSKKKMSFVEFMQSSPFKDIDLDLTRDKSPCREIDL